MKTATILALAVIAGGCGKSLRPAAYQVPGDKKAALAEVSGIRVLVRSNAWKGDPPNLEDAFTPIQTNITNQSPNPLRMRYNDFALVSDTGFRTTPLPPHRIGGSVVRTVAQPVYAPAFAYDRFWVAPYYGRYWGGYIGPWGGPFWWDTGYYGTYYATWREPLPTEDMLEKGIPEGVLGSGGRISGFLYFQRIPPEVRQVNFTANFIDAETEETIGTIDVPFVYQ